MRRWHFQPGWVGTAGFLLAAALVCGCGRDGAGARQATAVRSVRDATGREVQIPVQPTRVLSLCTTVTDTVARLGLLDRLAGMDEYSKVVPGTDRVAIVGKGSSLAREQVLARGVDLAFVWWYQDDAARLLEECRVPVLRVRVGRASEIPDVLRLVGLCFDRAQAADTLAASVLAQLQPRTSDVADTRPTVYLELYGPFKTAGRDSYLHDLLELAGGRNIAAETTGSALLSAERLLSADPDVVFLVAGFADADSFRRRPALDRLSAVRRGRVHTLDRYLLVAGAGLPQAAAQLRRFLNDHP